MKRLDLALLFLLAAIWGASFLLIRILNATTPLLTALVASLWLGAAFTQRMGVGILLGLLGVDRPI